MTLTICALGGIGVYQGRQIRSIRLGTDRSDEAKLTFQNARNLHPTLMSALLFALLIGVQSGLGSLLVQGKPILESAHSATALGVLLLFGVQGLLSLGIPTTTKIRDLHSLFGWAVIAGLALHFISGLFLGFST